LGAILIILFANDSTVVAKLLSAKWIVGIGLISYSAYLWHQPLFAFWRIYSLSQPSSLMMVALCAATFVAAFLSWKYVERPFRDRRHFRKSEIFAGALIGTLAFLCIGSAGYFAKGFSWRLDGKILAAVEPPRSDVSAICPSLNVVGHTGITRCAIGKEGVAPSVVLFGDSHADQIATEIDTELSARGLAGIILRNWDCGVIFGVYERHFANIGYVQKCMNSHQDLIKEITDQSSIKFVVIAIRWTQGLYPIPGYIEQRAFDNGEGGMYNPTTYYQLAVTPEMTFQIDADAKREAILKFIGSFIQTEKKIIVQYPVPETGWNIPELIMKESIRGIKPGTVTTNYARYKERNRYIMNVLDSLGSKIERFLPARILCDTFVKGRCVAVLDGTPLYTDDNHLSDFGVKIVVPDLMKIIDQGPASAAAVAP